MKPFKMLKPIITYLLLISLITILYTSNSSNSPGTTTDSDLPQLIYDLEDPF